MKHIHSTPEQRTWVEEVQYYLFRNKGVSFTLFLHNTIVNMSDDINRVRSIASIYMRQDGAYVLNFHWPSVKVLDIPAACELVKHEIMHVILGHTGSRGEKMVKQYGPDITNIGMDLAVNQHIELERLAKFGWPGVSVKKFGFPENQTSPWYCEALVKKIKEDSKNGNGKDDEKADGKGGMSISVPDWLAEELAKQGTPVQPAPKDFPAKGGEYSKAVKPGGTWDNVLGGPPDGEEPLSAEMRDIHAEKLISRIQGEMEKRQLCESRGWNAGETKEWIEQVQRGSQTPWYMLLRRLESQHIRVDRELTKKRPSRRHPDHFGRLRRIGLYCWFVVDTSGSMGTPQLQLVEPEVRGVHRRGATIDLIHCDAGISKIARYTNTMKVVEFSGRGGTDFSPVFTLLHDTPVKDRPKFIIYITDGYGGLEHYGAALDNEFGKGFYDQACEAKPFQCPDGVDVLWLIPEGCMKPEEFTSRVAKFGKVLSIPAVEGSGTKEAR